MLKENVTTQQDLTLLLHELNDITSDFSVYLNFLMQRRLLIEQVLMEGNNSNN